MERDGGRHLRRVAPGDAAPRPRNSWRRRAELTGDGRAHRRGGQDGPIEARIAALGLWLRRGGGRPIARGRRRRDRLGQLAAAAEAELVVVLVFFAAAVAGN